MQSKLTTSLHYFAEKVYNRQISAPILKRKSSRFGLGQFLSGSSNANAANAAAASTKHASHHNTITIPITLIICIIVVLHNTITHNTIITCHKHSNNNNSNRNNKPIRRRPAPRRQRRILWPKSNISRCKVAQVLQWHRPQVGGWRLQLHVHNKQQTLDEYLLRPSRPFVRVSLDIVYECVHIIDVSQKSIIPTMRRKSKWSTKIEYSNPTWFIYFCLSVSLSLSFCLSLLLTVYVSFWFLSQIVAMRYQSYIFTIHTIRISYWKLYIFRVTRFYDVWDLWIIIVCSGICCSWIMLSYLCPIFCLYMYHCCVSMSCQPKPPSPSTNWKSCLILEDEDGFDHRHQMLFQIVHKFIFDI